MNLAFVVESNAAVAFLITPHDFRVQNLNHRAVVLLLSHDIGEIIMNTYLFKWLHIITLFLCLIVCSTQVAAKKPVKPPILVDDPCASMQTVDFAFWRDSSSKRVPQVSIYLAESATGCEVKLLDIPLADTGPINDLKLAFSSVEDGALVLGRVVWARQINGRAISVWMHDFKIEDGSLVGVGEPAVIMENMDAENADINSIDLSPDMQSLVYQFEEDDDSGLHVWSIRAMRIENCVSPCSFNAGEILYCIEDTPVLDGLSSPVWGPLGTRIYFVEREGDYRHVKAIDTSGGNLVTLATVSNETGIVRQVSSGIGHGWPEEREYLAVTIGEPVVAGVVIHGCARVYTLDVGDCPAGEGCVLKYEVAGTFPSWTRDGKLIHISQGLTLKNPDNCKIDTIGSWDGSRLESLTKGYEPEAAGG